MLFAWKFLLLHVAEEEADAPTTIEVKDNVKPLFFNLTILFCDFSKGPPRRAEFRVIIRGLPPSGSWQDLKDHMREAGDCVYGKTKIQSSAIFSLMFFSLHCLTSLQLTCFATELALWSLPGVKIWNTPYENYPIQGLRRTRYMFFDACQRPNSVAVMPLKAVTARRRSALCFPIF